MLVHAHIFLRRARWRMKILGMEPVPQNGSSRSSVVASGRVWNLRDLFSLESCDIDSGGSRVTFTFVGDDETCRLVVRGVMTTQVGDLPDDEDVVDFLAEGVERLDSFSVNHGEGSTAGWFTLSTDGGFVINVLGDLLAFETVAGSSGGDHLDSAAVAALPRESADSNMEHVVIDLLRRNISVRLDDGVSADFPGVRCLTWSSWRNVAHRTPVEFVSDERNLARSSVVVGGAAGLRMNIVSDGIASRKSD